MLTQEGCRTRQRRLLKKMEEEKWDLFVTGDYRTVYYFSGVLVAADTPTLFLEWSDGSTGLIANSKASGFCDDTVYLETYAIQRCIEYPFHDAAALLKTLLSKKQSSRVRQCGLEMASVNGVYEGSLLDVFPRARLVDASRTLLSLRKRKEEDEIDGVRRNLQYCSAAYRAARETIAPGLTEVDVYNSMYSAIVKAAGTSVLFAGDFSCGERAVTEGGHPTARKIQSGDLYILDIFPCQYLYYADVTRTFSVTGPTDLQYRAWEIVMSAVRMAESLVKPGVAARDVYAQIKEFLDSEKISEKSFSHHVGHGIGHRGHEAPRIIPGSNDIFEEGDVLTIEPGMYTQALQGGIRLEDNYVLRGDGLEDLFDYPWEL
ncbi:MAG: aminopeptidase P family protein [Acidobacteria bacterium]|nr:aminopeptidase P family protein [Acidobacteriota bacterium]